MRITTTELYDFAEKNKIKIDSFHLKCVKSVSMVDTFNNCYIAVDNVTFNDDLECLAHEIGHCLTGAFYNRFSAYDLRAKQEYKADKWAIKKLIPADELKNAFDKGITEVWELAEYFNVSENFIKKAFEFYKINNYI